MMRLVIINVFFLMFILTSCRTTDNASSPDNFGKEPKTTTIRPVLVQNDFMAENALSDFVITKAIIEESTLSITISYTGCKDDVIDLVFNGNYLKSYPMKAQLYVKRSSGSQGCDKKMVQDLKFNLVPIKPGSGNTLILMLQNYKENLTYQY